MCGISMAWQMDYMMYGHVQSICDAMEIPHIETRWDFRLKRVDYSINLYPHPGP